jgi:hypothetical protein
MYKPASAPLPLWRLSCNRPWSSGATHRALSPIHQMEEHVEFAVEECKRLRDENERLPSGQA